MKNINLNLLITFHTVVKNNSFTLAADELVLSKSVISKQVQQLEKELQCTLIQRTTRTLSLTDEGRYLYEQYSKIIDDLHRCHDTLSQKNETVGGTLRVRLPIVLEHDLRLMRILSEFMISYPSVELEVTYGYTLDDLVGDNIDLAFHIGELPDSSFKCRKVKEIKTFVVASPSYLEKHGKPETPADLNDHTCMNYRSCLTKDKWKFHVDDNSYESVNLKSKIRSDSESLLVEMARQGVGVACALDFLAEKYLANGELVSLISDYTWATELYVVYPSKAVAPYKTRTFIDYLVNSLS
ncbi:LysR family transcriptional regulator [Photobacterium kasasachensis]|uniref:LysR family transcriptional regulator n=1 Tax=Photobacterium kasasachensis TaxID=2910240 RepID=UPI003D133D09